MMMAPKKYSALPGAAPHKGKEAGKRRRAERREQKAAAAAKAAAASAPQDTAQPEPQSAEWEPPSPRSRQAPADPDVLVTEDEFKAYLRNAGVYDEETVDAMLADSAHVVTLTMDDEDQDDAPAPEPEPDTSDLAVYARDQVAALTTGPVRSGGVRIYPATSRGTMPGTPHVYDPESGPPQPALQLLRGGLHNGWTLLMVDDHGEKHAITITPVSYSRGANEAPDMGCEMITGPGVVYEQDIVKEAGICAFDHEAPTHLLLPSEFMSKRNARGEAVHRGAGMDEYLQAPIVDEGTIGPYHSTNRNFRMMVESVTAAKSAIRLQAMSQPFTLVSAGGPSVGVDPMVAMMDAAYRCIAEIMTGGQGGDCIFQARGGEMGPPRCREAVAYWQGSFDSLSLYMLPPSMSLGHGLNELFTVSSEEGGLNASVLPDVARDLVRCITHSGLVDGNIRDDAEATTIQTLITPWNTGACEAGDIVHGDPRRSLWLLEYGIKWLSSYAQFNELQERVRTAKLTGTQASLKRARETKRVFNAMYTSQHAKARVIYEDLTGVQALTPLELNGRWCVMELEIGLIMQRYAFVEHEEVGAVAKRLTDEVRCMYSRYVQDQGLLASLVAEVLVNTGISGSPFAEKPAVGVLDRSTTVCLQNAARLASAHLVRGAAGILSASRYLKDIKPLVWHCRGR